MKEFSETCAFCVISLWFFWLWQMIECVTSGAPFPTWTLAVLAAMGILCAVGLAAGYLAYREKTGRRVKRKGRGKRLGTVRFNLETGRFEPQKDKNEG